MLGIARLSSSGVKCPEMVTTRIARVLDRATVCGLNGFEGVPHSRVEGVVLSRLL